MSIKKEIKKLATEDHQKILDESKDFYQSLIAEHYTKKTKAEKSKNFHWKKFSAIAAAVMVTIAVTTLAAVYWPQTGNDLDDSKHYYSDANLIDEYVELTEVENNIHSFSLNVRDSKLSEIILAHDSLSGDSLFYKITSESEDALVSWEMIIGVNEHFKLPFTENALILSSDLGGYTVKYFSQCVEEDGIYITTTNALIKFETETVHIDYTYIDFEEKDNFLVWLGESITKI